MHSFALQRVHGGGSQVAIAAAMGVSESTVSRLISGPMEQLMQVLAHAGLKLVDANARCFDAEYVDALMVLARREMTNNSKPRELDWD